MNENDKKSFAEIWRAALGTYGREASREMLELAFSILKQFPLNAVSRGISEHMQRSRFAPTPADVVTLIEAANPSGRPGPEEAWSICLGAMDEATTIVWTDEMAAAWGIANPVMQSGDDVGARMAFREAYNRKVDEAKREGKPVKWTPSLGHDKEARADVLKQAVEDGRLSHDGIQQLIPAPEPTQDGAAIAGLITGNATPASSETVRKHCDELRAMLAGKGDE